METEIKIVRGPSSTRLTKEAAATELEKLPGFPKEATYTIDEIDGRWVAAVVVPKVAAPFPPKDDAEESGPPADDSGDSEESGPPKAEKSDEGDSEGGDKPPSDGPPHQDGKMSVEHQLAQLTDMLTKITDALGLSDPSGMVPGLDDGSVPPPGGPDGPPGAGGPPGAVPPGKPGVGADNKMHTVHERSLKPGEAPPGTTPVGAPSFASVQVDDGHPWKDAIEAGVKEFEVESPIGDERLSAVAEELKMLAAPYGYIVTDLMPQGEGTSRTASARIVRTR